MEAYQGEGTYEPSADELIDVLKNLENLAAANPALYRAIVDQIKGMFFSTIIDISRCFFTSCAFSSIFSLGSVSYQI